MKINIYYGGRGVVDDPTVFVLDRMEAVLNELNVSVERFNLFEIKNAITTLPQTLKSSDGIILATTVEWHGIGGYMSSFLDAIWLYGDKEIVSKIYMMPVVMSTTYGEREAQLDLSNAWEILGGLACGGISGYIKDTKLLEENADYIMLIEKKAENLYRTVHQKLKSLPASNQAVNQTVAINNRMDLTPQETEQLSQYASDEVYVQRQREDIQELTSLFKGKLSENLPHEEKNYIRFFQESFRPQPGGSGIYTLKIGGRPDIIQLEVYQTALNCYREEVKKTEVELSMAENVLLEIIDGRMTFQKAFMTGVIKMRGEFAKFRMIDDMFSFK